MTKATEAPIFFVIEKKIPPKLQGYQVQLSKVAGSTSKVPNHRNKLVSSILYLLESICKANFWTGLLFIQQTITIANPSFPYRIRLVKVPVKKRSTEKNYPKSIPLYTIGWQNISFSGLQSIFEPTVATEYKEMWVIPFLVAASD